MSIVSKIFSDTSREVKKEFVIESENAQKASLNSLYVRTDAKYIEDKFGNIELKLTAAINEDLTNNYVKLSAETERTKILSQYSNDIITLIGQPTDAFSLHNLFNKVSSSIGNLPSAGNASTVKSLNELTKKFNSVHKSLQEMRGDIDKKIEKATFEINALLGTIRDNNNILRENEHDKNNYSYIKAQKDIWAAATELSGYFSITAKTSEDGVQVVNIITDDQIYNLIGRGAATEFFYKSDGVSRILSDEPFDKIVLRKFGASSKGLHAVDDFPIVFSGTNSKDTEYRIKDGKLGGLLEARDSLTVNAIDEVNVLAGSLIEKMNSMHNKMSSYSGASVLSGSANFNLETIVANEGRAKIALIDENGKPLHYDKYDFIPLELDMKEFSKIYGSEQTNVQAILTKINDYFSSENRRAEISGLYDIKLISKSREINIMNNLELVVEVTNAMQDSEVGLKINALKVTNGDGTEISSSATIAADFSIVEPGIRQSILSDLNITIENGKDSSGATLPGRAPVYPYTIELSVEVQSKDDNQPVQSKVVYEINNPDDYSNAINKMLGKSFSAKKVLPATVDSTNYGELKKIDVMSYISADLVGAEGKISKSGFGGFLELRSKIEKHKISILQVDEGMFGKPNGKEENIRAGFSEFFGLNDIFQSKNNKNWQHYENAARDISIRSDILKNPKLLSYSQLNLYRKEGEAYNVVSAYEVPIGRYEIERLWPEISSSTSNEISNFVRDFVSKVKGFNLLYQNQKSIKDGVEEQLNTSQGFNDGQLEQDLITISQRQSNLYIALQYTLKLNQFFIDTFRG